MLVTNRFVGEQLLIGDNVTITVLEVKGDSVRLGVQAPHHVPVSRVNPMAGIVDAGHLCPTVVNGHKGGQQ